MHEYVLCLGHVVAASAYLIGCFQPTVAFIREVLARQMIYLGTTLSADINKSRYVCIIHLPRVYFSHGAHFIAYFTGEPCITGISIIIYLAALYTYIGLIAICCIPPIPIVNSFIKLGHFVHFFQCAIFLPTGLESKINV